MPVFLSCKVIVETKVIDYLLDDWGQVDTVLGYWRTKGRLLSNTVEEWRQKEHDTRREEEIPDVPPGLTRKPSSIDDR